MKETKKCHECKQEFKNEMLISYASLKSKTSYNYCPTCLKIKQDRDAFSDKVCAIFGLKAPGPRIWTERKRIIEKYGYTDEIIIKCLDYLYNAVRKRKLSESLCLVTPEVVDQMLQYEKQKTNESLKIIRASQIEHKEYIVPTQELKNKKKQIFDPDSWLEDD